MLIGVGTAGLSLPGRAASAKRIGVLVGAADDDQSMRARLAVFRGNLEKLGWSDGGTVQIDYRFAPGGAGQEQALAKELIAVEPDVILAHTTPIVAALQRESRTIPIVFINVSDPIVSGFIASLVRPGGNITGMTFYEEGVVGKWLAMLKEISPGLTQAVLFGNPTTTPFDYFLRSAKSAGQSLAIEAVSDADQPIGLEHARGLCRPYEAGPVQSNR